MASSNNKCAGCRQHISDRYFLSCSICKETYDIQCANVPLLRFNNTMTKQHKSNWKCPLCSSKMAKTNNSNTPVRNEHDYDDEEHVLNVNKNRHQRRQAISPVGGESMISFEGDTLLEDSVQTIDLENNTIPNSPRTVLRNQATLEQINTLIQQNLQQNNTSFLQAIQNTIQKEIENALKHLQIDFKHNIDSIKLNQIATEKNISALEQKIVSLQNENSKLQKENKEIKEDLNSIKAYIYKISPEKIEGKTDTHVVLHGLTSQCEETDDELIDKVSYIFQEVLHIDISRYIEEITFIGKGGTRRPLKIELRNKRLRKHILLNSSYFREVGLSVTEYLTEPELKQRRELIQALQKARKSGQHAIIKNNKLMINGRQSSETDHRDELPNMRNVETHTQMNIEHSKYINAIQKQKNDKDTNDSINNETNHSSSKKNHSFR